MPCVMLPVLDASAAIDVDSAAAPVDAAAAPPSAAAPVAGIAPIVGISRIVGVRPIAKNHLRFVIGNVNAVGRCRFNVDKLAVLILIYRDLLFFRRDQLLPVIRF